MRVFGVKFEAKITCSSNSPIFSAGLGFIATFPSGRHLFLVNNENATFLEKLYLSKNVNFEHIS